MIELNSHGRVVSFLAAICLSAIVGCDQGVPLGTVTGRVTKGGQPQANLWVHFKPANGRPAEGRTNGHGEYDLTYTVNRKGALVGPNKVTIYSGGETDSRDNQLSPRVEVHTQEVEVESGANEINFELP